MPQVSFEQRVEGLQNYYKALQELDPRDPSHNEVADPAFFYYAGGHHASEPLRQVKAGVIYDIGCHGRVEYSNRGLETMDLREDTDELRAERADVLAVMTAPLTPEDRAYRAERIAGVLANIVSGQAVVLATIGAFRRIESTELVDIDLERELYGVFRNGHVSDRTLTVQYDAPVHFAPTDDVAVGEPVLNLNVPKLFTEEPALLKPRAA